MRRSSWPVKALDGFASHAFRSWAMTAFYAGILVAGVLGVVAPSASALDSLSDRAAVVLWTVIYVVAAAVGGLSRRRAWYRSELVALLMIVMATLLHAWFLVDSGMPGVQTGVRLVAGVMALVAVASMLRELDQAQSDGLVLVDREEVRRVVHEEVAARAEGRGRP